MEFKNNILINNFISKKEKKILIDQINTIKHIPNPNNIHIQEVRKNLNGNSYMFDISNTVVTNYITSFQSGNDTISDTIIPDIIYKIIDKLCTTR